VSAKFILLLFLGLTIVTVRMGVFGPKLLFLVVPAGFVGGAIIGAKQRQERERDDY